MGNGATRPEREPAAREPGRSSQSSLAAGLDREPGLIGLQRTAGNQAVTGLIRRQEAAGGTIALPYSPFAPPTANLNLPPTSRLAGEPAAGMSDAVVAKVRAYLEGRLYEIGDLNQKGAISMPEVVQQVREAVPEAVGAPVADIEKQVRAVLGGLTPPPVRRRRSAAGAGAELAARIANALPSAPKLRIDIGGGSIALTMSGIVATARAGGATVTATGGPSGGEVQVEGGGATVTATAKDGSFGLVAKIDRAAFAAKIERDATTGAWSQWEVGMRVAILGDEPLDPATDVPELQEAVRKAEAAVRGIIAHLQAGGSPKDPAVTSLIEDVKPAIEGVKSATERRSSTTGPRVTVGAGVKGGDEKLGTTAGLSLIIEF